MDGLFLPLMLALLVVFLFISFRNQKKRTQAMNELKAQAVPGARIQLSCGLFGTVHSDDGGESVEVEIAPGVITTWNRLAIRDVIADEAPEYTPGDNPREDLPGVEKAGDDPADTPDTPNDPEAKDK
ncbi:preprotein translocase subunit YajC [Gordonia alkaliphila]|uniref:Preprotein translocase subunit YajC n=1 Tax=Gordonia alkaliphila TaxID=1053547 RepID=A0ABP8YXD6_9ACTN